MASTINEYQKYQKYKTKYLHLKTKQFGGGLTAKEFLETAKTKSIDDLVNDFSKIEEEELVELFQKKNNPYDFIELLDSLKNKDKHENFVAKFFNIVENYIAKKIYILNKNKQLDAETPIILGIMNLYNKGKGGSNYVNYIIRSAKRYNINLLTRDKENRSLLRYVMKHPNQKSQMELLVDEMFELYGEEKTKSEINGSSDKQLAKTLTSYVDELIKRKKEQVERELEQQQENERLKKERDDIKKQFLEKLPPFELTGVSKEINGIKFELGNVKLTIKDRIHVRIRTTILTTGESHILTLYTSKSEGGFWRLCVYFMNSYEKGSDYITSTFICIDLQIFINNHLEDLRNITLETNETIKKHDINIDDLVLEYWCPALESDNLTANEIFQYIKLKERQDKNPDFEFLETLCSSTCFQPKKISWTKLSDDAGFGVISTNEERYIPNFYDICNNDERIVKSDKYMEFKHYFKNCDINDENIVSIFYNAIGEFLKAHFELSDNEKLIFLGKMEFVLKHETGEEVKINHQIFQIKIIHKETKQKYNINISKYLLDNQKHNIFNGTYWAILNIVPSDTLINKYGLYDKIVSVGPITQKIFEYHSQFSSRFLEKLKGFPERTVGKYYFVGDIIQNFWPLTIIRDDKYQEWDKSNTITITI
ncbi:hypothetical protein Indivirus_2_57 [Indivirus ILV1]|uniref:Uncharacterized protein n=1 Tax=Indivirus ILV1 TaxID=1977633 RepID=A0A1V0SDE5_9VIRU|nr:hypothetical protein Indivirus_2_57 [Indivirus ILV1]